MADEPLVRIRNEHGAEFTVPKSHYDQHARNQNLVLVSAVVPQLTRDLFVADRLCWYLDRMNPVGELVISVFCDNPPNLVEFYSTCLDSYKRDRIVWVSAKKNSTIGAPFLAKQEMKQVSSLYHIPDTNHLVVVGGERLLDLFGALTHFALSIRRGGLLCLVGVHPEEQDNLRMVIRCGSVVSAFSRREWEWLRPLAAHRAEGIEVFRRLTAPELGAYERVYNPSYQKEFDSNGRVDDKSSE